ncbi:terminase family protein [Patescibacteria group bacterium]|nr:terminase family protein [Patescibacteria group bacterium]
MKFLNPHAKQQKIAQNKNRFKVVRAGRRGGKTALEIEDLVATAISKDDMPVFYIAPTQKQAREIVWEGLKRRMASIGDPNESLLEMKVPTVNGGYSIISVAGWENRENFRGKKAKKIVFDEVDTMRDFFIGWQEIFRPTLIDLNGEAIFIGTPKKENPNLRRLEKMAEEDDDYAVFHFTSWDNPHLDRAELEKAKQELDPETYRQEIMAEYVENRGALFSYDALMDTFSNILTPADDRYLIIDANDDGGDKMIFSYWQGLEEYKQKEVENMKNEEAVEEIRNEAQSESIPFSNILVDGIGVGARITSSRLLNGIVVYKGSYAAIKTDMDIVKLPNIKHVDHEFVPKITDYRNLRNQCIFTLAEYVNNRLIASKVTGRGKEEIIEELRTYQDASKGDGKRIATPKEDVKALIGRSPDRSDCWQMRMYFEVKRRATDEQDDLTTAVIRTQDNLFIRRKANQVLNNAR